MEVRWRDAELVQLRDGFTIADADGQSVSVVKHVRIAIEGGYLHIDVPGAGGIQTVGAPALARAVCPRYQA